MEEKNMDEIKKYLWTEYDGEDVDFNDLPDPTEEDLRRLELFYQECIKMSEEQQKQQQKKTL